MIVVQKKNEKKIEIIENIRGLAALSVCLFHLVGNRHLFGLTKNFENISQYRVGVQTFFVLSGFIIPFSLLKSGYKVSNFFFYFWKRWLRIDLPYIVAILLAVSISYLSTIAPTYIGKPFNISIGQLVSHLVYSPTYFGYNWIVVVFWTLEAEFHFFIIIGLILPLIWKNKASLIVVFLLGCIGAIFIPLTVFIYMPLYIMGIATCAYKTEKIIKQEFFLILVVSTLVSLLIDHKILIPIIGSLTALAIAFFEFNKSRLTAFLGKISFSLYLTHFIIGSKVINLGRPFVNKEWEKCLLLIITLFVTIIFAYIFHKLIVTPAQNLSKKVKYQFLTTP